MTLAFRGREELSINEQIREYINNVLLDGQADDLTDDTPLRECGILDSFGLMSLLSFLSEAYGMPADPSVYHLDSFESIGNIVKLIHNRSSHAIDG